MTVRWHQRGLLFPFLHFLRASLICLLLVTVRDTQQKRGEALEMSGNVEEIICGQQQGKLQEQTLNFGS